MITDYTSIYDRLVESKFNCTKEIAIEDKAIIKIFNFDNPEKFEVFLHLNDGILPEITQRIYAVNGSVYNGKQLEELVHHLLIATCKSFARYYGLI